MNLRAPYSLTRAAVTRVSLGLAAFLIYSAATLLANQNTQVGQWLSYDIERTGIASAISNIVYAAPVATVYKNLAHTFQYSEVPLEELIRKAEHKQIELGELGTYVDDGIGIGQAVFTTVAMRLFGIHPQSIVLLFLFLMGVATLVFLARFHDERSVVIVVVFLALTIMFASPMGASIQGISQVPVGGHRYFSLLAVIPCLHIFLELIDSIRRDLFTRGAVCLLAAQVIIFMIVYFMSAAAIYVYGPLVLAAIYAYIATRGASQSRRILLGKILIVVGMVGSLLLTFAVLTPRAYRITGRAMAATTWHHVIIGFGANPNWPFGNLADIYRGCTPGQPNDSLVPGFSDFNGGCIWADYAKRHELSFNQYSEGLYDKNFDAATKEGVFRIVRLYPFQSLLTFVYYKPLLILDTLAQCFRLSFPATWPVAILIIGQIAVFLAFAALNRSSLSVRALKQACFGLAICAISTSGLYIVAYSSPIVSADLFFYVLALICTLIANLIGAISQSFWPSTLSCAEVALTEVAVRQ